MLRDGEFHDRIRPIVKEALDPGEPAFGMGSNDIGHVDVPAPDDCPQG
jgi:hypothetical protein